MKCLLKELFKKFPNCETAAAGDEGGVRDAAGEVPAVEQLVPAGQEGRGGLEGAGAEERRAEEGGWEEGAGAHGAAEEGEGGGGQQQGKSPGREGKGAGVCEEAAGVAEAGQGAVRRDEDVFGGVQGKLRHHREVFVLSVQENGGRRSERRVKVLAPKISRQNLWMVSAGGFQKKYLTITKNTINDFD